MSGRPASPGRLGRLAHRARVLAGARLARPARPDRLVRAAAAVARSGQTPAGAYAALAALYPREPALIDELGALTFAEVHERTDRLAGALFEDGIGEGDGVAVMCRNHRGFVESVVALSKLGANALLLNTGLASPQLAAVLDRERPRAVIYDAEFAALIPKPLLWRSGYVAWREGGGSHRRTLEHLMLRGEASTPSAPSRPGRTTILTSGTTGAPKGASRPSPGVSAAVAILELIPLRAR